MHLKPSAIEVRDRLRNGPANTHELMQADVGGRNFPARIYELRQAGYVIDSRRIRQGSTLYTLVAEPSDEVVEAAAA